MDALKTIANDKTIFFEIHTNDQAGLREVSSVKEKLTESLDAFEKALEVITAVAEGTVNKIKQFDQNIAPDEFELQFGIKLSAEYGAVLAATSGEAQLSVKMTYKHEKRKAQGK
jgi:hypothetical protein